MAAVELAAGSRRRSAVSEVEVIVVSAPSAPVVLTCGGAPMVGFDDPVESAGAALDGAATEPTLLGKRYVDAETGLEVLCTKGGDGSLAVDGRPLPVKDAKPLPSSD